jgi:hypothetical protein
VTSGFAGECDCFKVFVISNNNNNNNNAVVKADDRYTPLDLIRANGNELATDEEYNNKVKRQLSQRALHGRHPYELSQQHVDIEASTNG